MIRIANNTDLGDLASMLRDLYKEISLQHAVEDINVYRVAIQEHFDDERDVIYIEEGKGFYIVRDETEPMTPNLNRYNGIRVYIKPQHRHTRLLANFYKRLFEDYPDGDIVGVTEINSPHIKVLDKRHSCLAKVYKLERSRI